NAVEQELAGHGDDTGSMHFEISAAPPGLAPLGADEVGSLKGQVFFLDLSGATDVRYNGPVTVTDIDMPAFRVPGNLAGQEAAVVSSLVASLAKTYAGTGVIFTTQRPVTGTDYSTIYIGGTGEEFAAYGYYLGLAEQVDTGNRDHGDNALVFSDNIISPVKTAEEYGQLLGGYVAHEAGHLLGFEHDHDHDHEAGDHD